MSQKAKKINNKTNKKMFYNYEKKPELNLQPAVIQKYKLVIL